MEIRFYLSFCLSHFIICNVSELNATLSHQKNINSVCGKPAQGIGLIIHGQELKRGEFPWMVALLNKSKIPAEFFCAGTLISTRHVITGKNQMQNQISSSFSDRN